MEPKKTLKQEQRILALESELRDREIEIALLKETAEAVSSELDLEKVFQLVVNRARSLILAETVLLPVLDKDCVRYTYRAGCGKNADEIVGQSLPLEFGVCGWVWRHKRPWWHGVLNDLDEAERNKWEKKAGSIILVPLSGKDHFLGGLAGINKIKVRTLPWSACSWPTMMRRSVVLPQPLGPTNPTRSPGLMTKETLSRTISLP